MNRIRKIISKVFEIILPFIDKMAYLRYFNNPFSNYPISTVKNYQKLAKISEINTYSIEDVDLIEKENGYSINKDWLNSLALLTQVVVKRSELNYAHGRILYSVLRKYLSSFKSDSYRSINILETGTARGFSAICMAKALSDSKFHGSIFTVDVLPHDKEMFWNCVADHTSGKQTRKNLLSNWSELTDRYIIFIQGFAKHILPKIGLKRVHFAFLDGAHTYDDVLFEFNNISKHQKEGDIIIFDDYNESDFPGIVKAVKYIESKMEYKIKFVKNKNTLRDYAIAKKTSKKN